MVAYPSFFNATSLQLSDVDLLVSLFRNVVQVRPLKRYPMSGDHINSPSCQKIFLNITISIVFKKCLKQIIKQNVILGRDIPSSQVLDVCCQGRMIVRKNQKFPSRER